MGRLFLSMIVGAVIAAGIGHWQKEGFDIGALAGEIQVSSGTMIVKHGK